MSLSESERRELVAEWKRPLSGPEDGVRLRQLTHQDPTVALAKQVGDEIVRVKELVDDLERRLARLDEVTEQLRGKGVTVEVDLGEVGNAARSARKVQAMASPRRTFSFPA